MTGHWTPETWRDLTTMNGKVAVESDFIRGTAVFYQQGPIVEPVEMSLPQPAILTLDKNRVAVVVVQAERTRKPDGPFVTLGAVSATGEHFVFCLDECCLVEDTDPTWLALAGKCL